MMKYVLSALVVFAMISSCKKDQTFSATPEVSFDNFINRKKEELKNFMLGRNATTEFDETPNYNSSYTDVNKPYPQNSENYSNSNSNIAICNTSLL